MSYKNEQSAGSTPDIAVSSKHWVYDVYVIYQNEKPFLYKLPYLVPFAVCLLRGHAVTLSSQLAHPSCHSSAKLCKKKLLNEIKSKMWH